MKASSNSISSLAARSLQLVGLIMIVSFIIDIFILAMPPNPLNRQWRLGYTTQLIDRGVIPLVGIVLLLGGIWIKDASGMLGSKQGLLKSAAVLTSLILGIVYVLLVPLHSIDTVRARSELLSTLNREAKNAEEQVQLSNPQVQATLDRQRAQFKAQITGLLDNPDQLAQAIEQSPEQQAERLREFQANPDAIDTFIDQQIGELPERARQRIRNRQQEQANQIQVNTLKSMSQSINGGLLAVGYLGIGLAGVQFGGGGKRKKRRK